MAREDGGTTGDRGRRETADDGRQRTTGDSGRRTTADDGRQRTTDDSTPATLGAILGTRGRGERVVLLVRCTRCCVREGEGSGEKASIYMILAPTLAPCATPPATPPRTTVTLFPTKAELPRGSYLPCFTIIPRFL